MKAYKSNNVKKKQDRSQYSSLTKFKVCAYISSYFFKLLIIDD